MTSRRSSGSKRTESGVEPTRSQNITVSWRRSAPSPRGAAVGGGTGGWVSSAAIARSMRLRWPSTTPSFSRSASVSSGKISASIAFSRKIGSYCVSPRLRSHAEISTASPAACFSGMRSLPRSSKPPKEERMPVTIYHNPRCNTSRKTLALLREKGVEPQIIEYLKTPYTAAQLKQLLGQLGMPASKLLRKKEAAAAAIDPSKLWEDQLIEAMVKNPIIVERPIVVSGRKAALGRPPEAVLAVL